jgi:hypothetical protein
MASPIIEDHRWHSARKNMWAALREDFGDPAREPTSALCNLLSTHLHVGWNKPQLTAVFCTEGPIGDTRAATRPR